MSAMLNMVAGTAVDPIPCRFANTGHMTYSLSPELTLLHASIR